MIQFKGFKPEAMQRIAGTLGYQGDMNGFNEYLQKNPDKNDTLNMYQNKAIEMARGGATLSLSEGAGITDITAKRLQNPKLNKASTVNPVGTVAGSNTLISGNSGQVSGNIKTPTTLVGKTSTSKGTKKTKATTVGTSTTVGGINKIVNKVNPVQGTVSDDALVEAETMDESSVSGLEAAQGTGIMMDSATQREIQDGELVSGVANANRAAKFTEQIQAASARPSKKATVQGQLDRLMDDFEGGETPAWAAGAMRAASAAMAARGLGASSMAGQAVIQATMESALPIAQADAGTNAAFEAQNLSNRQERSMLAAQQRAAFIGQEFDQKFQARVINASKISDVANMNFTAEQQVALENSRIANTVNMANLNNSQAMVMAEAAALANMDMANLSNRQQAAVQNAQNFMAMDMANADRAQQTTLFKAQQRSQALFTDAAARNASAQFNATSKNQTDQFFANLATQNNQFNASQNNAIKQFNAGEKNSMNRFSAEMVNQRQQFNANNRLVIDQSNAKWRREIATADTTAINRANELNASAALDISNTAYNNMWSYYSDTMEYAYTAADNERERMTKLAMVKLEMDAKFDIEQFRSDYQSSASMGASVIKLLTSPLKDSIIGSIF